VGGWLVVCEAGWLVVSEVGWLVVCEAGWLVVSEVGWLVVCEAGWLVGWWVEHSVNQLVSQWVNIPLFRLAKNSRPQIYHPSLPLP